MEYKSGQDHDRREQLSHGQRSQYESQLKVGFSEKLQEKSECPIEDQEKSCNHTVAKTLLAKEPQQGEENRPLHEGLVKLRRMAREGAAIWKNHPPRKLCDPAVEFTVNKICDPPQAKTDRRGDNHPVSNSPKWKGLAPAKPPSGNHGADQAAVKGHAAVPDGNDFQGITNKIRQIHVLVKKDVSQPGSGNKSNGKVKDEILDQTGREAYGAALFLPLDEKIGGEKAQHVHQAVPSYLERADFENIRIDVWIGNHPSAL